MKPWKASRGVRREERGAARWKNSTARPRTVRFCAAKINECRPQSAMQREMSSKQGYLPTLDGWRTIAILAVILDHVVAWQFTNAPPRLLQLTHTGADGVSLFFAISGFLICSRLLEEEDSTGQIGRAHV